MSLIPGPPMLLVPLSASPFPCGEVEAWAARGAGIPGGVSPGGARALPAGG